MNAIDLCRIEERLEAFGEWYVRVVDEGGPYDRAAAMEDYRRLEWDMRQLISQARDAYREWIEACR